METVRLLKGMCDVPPSQWTRLRSAEQSLRRHLGLYGYQPVDLPLVEETELFLRKSGGELAARLYSFTDPGGRRVSLRPEFTASAVRAYMQGSLGAELPLRLQYTGPVFRYHSEEDDGHRQFTQVGAELLGMAGAAADAEVVALAYQGLARLGLGDGAVTMGHLGVWSSLLEQMGISERARVFLLGSVSRLRDGQQAGEAVRQRARDLGLLGPSTRGGRAPAGTVRRLGRDQARDVMEGLLHGTVAGPTGQRTPAEIFHRYRRRLEGLDNPRRLERALELLGRLAAVAGPPSEALREAQEVVSAFGLATDTLSHLQEILHQLRAYEIEEAHLRVDFGLARGIAYYTGVVFELTHPALGPKLSLGGGGRYDELVTALGGKEPVPALGFAFALEQVVAAQERLEPPPPPAPLSPGVLVRPRDSSAWQAAARAAEDARRAGTPAELDTTDRSLNEARAYAARRGLASIRVVRQNGSTKDYPPVA